LVNIVIIADNITIIEVCLYAAKSMILVTQKVLGIASINYNYDEQYYCTTYKPKMLVIGIILVLVVVTVTRL